jgi:hypothetical protein
MADGWSVRKKVYAWLGGALLALLVVGYLVLVAIVMKPIEGLPEDDSRKAALEEKWQATRDRVMPPSRADRSKSHTVTAPIPKSPISLPSPLLENGQQYLPNGILNGTSTEVSVPEDDSCEDGIPLPWQDRIVCLDRRELDTIISRGTNFDRPAAFPAGFLEKMDELEERYFGDGGVAAEERSLAPQWAILRAHMRGDHELMHRYLEEYLRRTRGYAHEYPRRWDRLFTHAARFIILLEDLGAVDQKYLADAQRYFEHCLLSPEEAAALEELHMLTWVEEVRNNEDEAKPLDNALTKYTGGLVTTVTRPLLEPLARRTGQRAVAAAYSENEEEQYRAMSTYGIISILMNSEGPLDRISGPPRLPHSHPEIEAEFPDLVYRREHFHNYDTEQATFLLAAARFRRDHGANPATDGDLEPAYISPDVHAQFSRRWCTYEQESMNVPVAGDVLASQRIWELLEQERRQIQSQEELEQFAKEHGLSAPDWRFHHFAGRIIVFNVRPYENDLYLDQPIAQQDPQLIERLRSKGISNFAIGIHWDSPPNMRDAVLELLATDPRVEERQK